MTGLEPIFSAIAWLILACMWTWLGYKFYTDRKRESQLRWGEKDA